MQNKLSFRLISRLMPLFWCLVLLFFFGCRSSKKTKKPDIRIALSAAKSFWGTPYRYGGLSRKGLDCSGLMYLSWQEAGHKIPRTSKSQSEYGKPIKRAKLLPGDLVFFSKRKIGRKIVHVGMVSKINDGKVIFIHASTSKGVREDVLGSKYWNKRFVKATRIVY